MSWLRWVVRHRAWRPYHLVRVWRFALFKVRHRHVVTEGFVFLGKRVEVYARPGYGRVVLGRWVHLGDGCRLRAHEGTLRVGEKTVFGSSNIVNCHLDIEIGPRCLVSDWVYIGDFDHRTDDLRTPIKDQGIVKAPVRIGPDVWLGVKSTVLRGVEVGEGTVVGAHAVVTRSLPPRVVAAGAPAVVLRPRGRAGARRGPRVVPAVSPRSATPPGPAPAPARARRPARRAGTPETPSQR
jgi:acetyltransferase-like isoleucine patch superfamily enzyme